MATKKISELEAVTTVEDNDVLVLVDVSEGTTNKITKGNLLLGSGNQIEIDLDSATYQLVFKLKNSEGTVLSTATIDLPSENAITKIEYENGKLTLTKQSGATSQVDISGLIEGLVTESDFNGFKEALQETIQGITETLGEINTKNLEQDKKLAENYNEINNLKEQVTDAENNQLTSNASGTSIDISDSASYKNRSIGLIGNTTQESTTGKQLFDISQVQAQSGSTSNSSGKVELRDNGFKLTKLTAAGDGNGRYTGSIPCVLEAGNYIISGKLNDKSNLHIMAIFGGSKVVVISGNSIAFSLDNAVTGLQFCLRLEEEQNTYVEYSDIMIRPSTITDDTYEPYTGGIASPNPSYPQDIKNTGDNGFVNEKVQNKNFLPTDNINKVQAGVTILSQNGGSLLFNGTKRGSGNFDLNNNVFELEAGDYTLCSRKKSGSATGTVYHRLFNVDKNTEEFSKEVYQPYIFTNWGSYGLLNFTVTEKSKYYFRMVIPDGVVYTDFDLETIICKGTLSAETIGDFVKHEEQNISLTLPEGMKLCKIGEVADYFHKKDGKWYKHEAIGEKVIGDDVSVIGLNLTGYAFPKFEINKSYLGLPNSWQLNIAISDKWHNTSTSNLTSGGFSTGSSLRQITFWHKDVTTVAEAKELLVGSKFQFVKEKPTEIEITDETLIAQLEAMQNIRTYKNVTHISSEDETPATVEIEYVVDTKTYIDNEIETLKNAVISLGGNV